MIWSKLDARGYVPEARKSHSACAVPMADGGCLMVVFGGVVGGARVNTVTRFHRGEVDQWWAGGRMGAPVPVGCDSPCCPAESAVWSSVETFGGAPSPRCGPCPSACDLRMQWSM